MELKQIKELMTAMGRTGTKRLTIKKKDLEITIERHEHEGRFIEQASDLPEEHFKEPEVLKRANQALSRGSEMPSSRSSQGPASEASQENVASHYITSPMVGTCYTSPSPQDPPFIKKGDRVDKNTVVCIIEAMKVMNEIKANVTGTVAEVLVETSQPVEFGAKLFRITE